MPAVITPQDILIHIIECDTKGERAHLTDGDRSVLYEHMKTLTGSSELHRAAGALVDKLGTLTWRDRDIGFKEWKAVADLLAT